MKVHLLIIVSLLFVRLSSAQEVSNESITYVWSFNDCVDYALEHNITVKDAALNKNIANVDYQKSRSQILPNLFGSASQSFTNGNTIDPITSDFVSDQINSTNVGLNSSLTLFQGHQLQNRIKQNRLLLEQSVLQEDVEKNNIVLYLLEIYLQTLYSKESVKIAENNLAASEKEALRAKALLEAETLTLGDYTEAQSQAATNKYNVIAAKNTYQQYIIELKQILELSPNEHLEITPIDENQTQLNSESDSREVYHTALNFMPEIGVSSLNIAASQKSMDIARGAYLPTLALTGSLGSGYTSINNNTFSDQFNVNFNQCIGLTLSIPIFNRNQTKASVQTATINIEKAHIQKLSAEKAIYKKVELAYQNALSAQEQLTASQISQENAEQSYKLAQKKYELGDLSTTDLVISQNT